MFFDFLGVFFFFPKALRAKGSRLVVLGVWGNGSMGSLGHLGVTGNDLGATAPMQRGAHYFEKKKSLPCSVALKVLGVTSA